MHKEFWLPILDFTFRKLKVEVVAPPSLFSMTRADNESELLPCIASALLLLVQDFPMLKKACRKCGNFVKVGHGWVPTL